MRKGIVKMKSTGRVILEWVLFFAVIAGMVYAAWWWIPKGWYTKPELDPALIDYVNTVPEGCAWKAVSGCEYKILMECLTDDDLKSTDGEGRTLLHYAVTTPKWAESQNACLASIVYLNIKGIGLDRKDARGLTSLHYASMRGNPIAVIYLYQKDEDLLEERDNLGFTPLNYAETYSQLGGEQYTSVINFLRGMAGLGALVPINTYSYLNWIEGVVYSDMGEFDQAIARFEKSIQYCGDDAACLQSVGWYSHWMRGVVYDKLEKYDEAIKDFSIAIEHHPEEINLFYNRGKSYYSLGKCESARDDLQQYIVAVLSHTDVNELLTGESSEAWAAARSMMETCVDKP